MAGHRGASLGMEDGSGLQGWRGRGGVHDGGWRVNTRAVAWCCIPDPSQSTHGHPESTKGELDGRR